MMSHDDLIWHLCADVHAHGTHTRRKEYCTHLGIGTYVIGNSITTLLASLILPHPRAEIEAIVANVETD